MNLLHKFQDLFAIRMRWRNRPAPAPIAPTTINSEASISYVLNDMTTPLVKNVAPMPPASPCYIVKDYLGGGYALGTKESHAANCYTTVTNTLNYYRRVVPNFIDKWAGTSVLRVIPDAGADLNAFYDRKSIQFFFYGRHEIGGTIFTADSADVVAHELGHAILDAYLPNAFSAASLEFWAMHEAFADWTAITNILSHDEIIQHVLNETAGNLRQSNVASRLAEHVGKAIYILTKDTNRNPDCLRNAVNDFQYIDPSTLPKDGPSNQLCAECHNFGRLFLGVLYDMLIEVYEDQLSKCQDPAKSLQEAVAAMAQRVNFAIRNAPINVRFFESMGKTLLWAENTTFGNVYYDRFHKVLLQRKIVPEIKLLGTSSCDNEERVVRLQSTIRVKLGDHLVRAQANNPLYDVEVEIPHEQAYFYDSNKQLLDIVAVSEEQSLLAAQAAIEYLHAANQVSNSAKTPFEIRDGKLVRTHFSWEVL